MVILLIECTDAVCRVPYIVLSHRLSILYPRTCVGLGYGNQSHSFPDPVISGLSVIHSSFIGISQ